MNQTDAQLLEENDEVISCQVDKTAKESKKTKFTAYLTKEAENALAELYISRYRKDRKVERSGIVCEAIEDLFKKELA